MLNIGSLIIFMDDIRFITLLESGKDFKDALLSYYSNDLKKCEYIKNKVNSKSVINILAKNEEDLDYFLTFFESINLGKKQKIKLRTYGLRVNKLYEILSLFEDNEYFSRLLINLDHNTEFIPYKKFKRFANVLNGIISIIPDNLSQVEIITYVYDIVKSRTYKLVPGDEKSYKSRLLSDVMIKEYISCVGFAKMFNAILAEYSINASEYMYIPKDGVGHDVSLVNVNDDKYDIHGLYFFDPCMDSYLKSDGEKNISKYKGFFRTIDDYANIPTINDSFSGLLQTDDSEIDELLNFYKEVKNYMQSNICDDKELNSSINNVLSLFSLSQDLDLDLDYILFSTGKSIDDEINIYTCLKKVKKMFGKELDYDTFIKILFYTKHNKQQIVNALYNKYDADIAYSFIDQFQKKKTN